MKTTVITGITGQDGAYLAEFLLDKGYKVYGTYRRLSSPNFWRIKELSIENNPNLYLVEYDLTDMSSKNICTRKAYSLREVIALCEKITGHHINIKVNHKFIRPDDVKTLTVDRSYLNQAFENLRTFELKEILNWILYENRS